MRDDLAPKPDELKRLPSIHSILGALNDPDAGVPQLRRYCAELPSLRARILHEARRSVPGRDVEDVGYALAVIGNRGFEVVLLEYLEALTILKADLEDEQREAIAQKAGTLPSWMDRAAQGSGRHPA
ncbi:MAG: hypothetical protein JNK04_14670 [Myxococcales bacterium]|nr:hypothetical protein [Myxococcales bacterium]